VERAALDSIVDSAPDARKKSIPSGKGIQGQAAALQKIG
jgi:hypothetical protein